MHARNRKADRSTTVASRSWDPRALLDFIRLCERIKTELRHSWLSSGRRESVAEHSWLMAMLAVLTHRELERPVDILRTLQMVVVHDLVEAICGDVRYTAMATVASRALKSEREAEAMRCIRSMLPDRLGDEIAALWEEYEARLSPEAMFAKALDNLEVQIQHNLAELDTWEEDEFGLVYTKMDPYCEHDAFLRTLCEAVKADAEKKWRANGIDPALIRAQASMP
jgi:putative hydrolase of HD superfamily